MLNSIKWLEVQSDRMTLSVHCEQQAAERNKALYLIFPLAHSRNPRTLQFSYVFTAVRNELNLKAFRHKTYPAVTIVQGATKRVTIDTAAPSPQPTPKCAVEFFSLIRYSWWKPYVISFHLQLLPFKTFPLLANITLGTLILRLYIYVVQTLYPASTINGGSLIPCSYQLFQVSRTT